MVVYGTKICLFRCCILRLYKTAATAWALGDIGVGIMAWVNIIAILLLQKPALVALKDYEKQKKEGKDPVFDPDH